MTGMPDATLQQLALRWGSLTSTNGESNEAESDVSRSLDLAWKGSEGQLM